MEAEGFEVNAAFHPVGRDERQVWQREVSAAECAARYRL